MREIAKAKSEEVLDISVLTSHMLFLLHNNIAMGENIILPPRGVWGSEFDALVRAAALRRLGTKRASVNLHLP